jgi:hypothetical protein
MALGINETISNDQHKSKHLVYRDGTYVKFPNKDKEIVACILPSIADIDDKASYLPYRDEDNLANFTKWAIGLKMHPFVNKTQNIISPHSFDPLAFDPIDELIKVAKADEKYCLIAGFGPDGKRLVNAYKNPDVRLSSKWSGYVVNAKLIFDREIDQDKAVLLQIPGTAFRKPGRSSNDNSQSWGLLSELNRKNRKSSGEGMDNFYWGDITNPHSMIPCCLKLTPNPAGGLAIYNMTPLDSEDPVKASRALLESRYDLDKVLCEISEGAIIERLVYMFSDVPKLLLRAFAHRVPNFEKMLAKASATNSTAIPQEEEDEGEESVFAPAAPRKKVVEEDEEETRPESREVARSFSPDEDELPMPSPKKKVAQVLEEDEDDIENVKVESIPVRNKVAAKAAVEGKKISIRDMMD